MGFKKVGGVYISVDRDFFVCPRLALALRAALGCGLQLIFFLRIQSARFIDIIYYVWLCLGLKIHFRF